MTTFGNIAFWRSKPRERWRPERENAEIPLLGAQRRKGGMLATPAPLRPLRPPIITLLCCSALLPVSRSPAPWPVPAPPPAPHESSISGLDQRDRKRTRINNKLATQSVALRSSLRISNRAQPGFLALDTGNTLARGLDQRYRKRTRINNKLALRVCWYLMISPVEVECFQRAPNSGEHIIGSTTAS